MKKVFVLLLVFLMVFPFSAFADQDPIVGVWYICVDVKDLAQDLLEQGYIYDVIIYCFKENGEILYTAVDFKGSSGEMVEPSYIGKWEKNGSEYKTSIIASGVDRAWFEDDLLYVCMNGAQYHGFRKMTNLDLYYNIYRK